MHFDTALLTYNLRIALKRARAAADNPAWDPTTHGAVMMVPFFFVMWVMFVALVTCLGAHQPSGLLCPSLQDSPVAESILIMLAITSCTGIVSAGVVRVSFWMDVGDCHLLFLRSHDCKPHDCKCSFCGVVGLPPETARLPASQGQLTDIGPPRAVQTRRRGALERHQRPQLTARARNKHTYESQTVAASAYVDSSWL